MIPGQARPRSPSSSVKSCSRPGWRTVAYYIQRGERDSNRFLEAVNVQLLDLVGAQGGLPWSFAEKRLQFDTLWECASAHPRPLALIVDGFDQQTANHPLVELMPRTFGISGRIVVVTRTYPEISAWVDQTHPLAQADHVFRLRLEPSPHAKVIQEEAERDVEDLLDNDPVTAGLIEVASEVTAEELANVVTRPPGEIRKRLNTTARCLELVSDSGGARRFRWGHPTLIDEVRKWWGPERLGLVEKIATRADHYRDLGWPNNTPKWYLTHLDNFAEREGLGPLRWLQPQRRERMLRTLLHLGPFVRAIYHADERFREGSDLVARLQLVTEWLEVLERADLPDTLYPALYAAGRRGIAEEAASEILGEWPDGLIKASLAADSLRTSRYARGIREQDIPYFAGIVLESSLQGNRSRRDAFLYPGAVRQNEAACCQYVAAIAWHIARDQLDEEFSAKTEDRLAVAGALVDIALEHAFNRPLRIGKETLAVVAEQLAEPRLDVALSIAMRHPDRSDIAISLAEQQDHPVDPASTFNRLASLVDNDPASIARFAYSAAPWAPEQAANLTLRVLAAWRGEIDDLMRDWIIQGLALVAPEKASELIPHESWSAPGRRRLIALGVVDYPDRFEAALNEVIRHAEPGEESEDRDWTLSGAIERLARRDAPRALTLFGQLETPEWVAEAANCLAHSLPADNPVLRVVANRALEAAGELAKRYSRRPEWVVGQVIRAVCVIDPRRALRLAREAPSKLAWKAADEAVGRLALIDPEEALLCLDQFEYPTGGRISIARQLALTDPRHALQLCGELGSPLKRACTRAQVAALATEPDVAERGFSEALNATHVIDYDYDAKDALATIVASLIVARVPTCRADGATTLDLASRPMDNVRAVTELLTAPALISANVQRRREWTHEEPDLLSFIFGAALSVRCVLAVSRRGLATGTPQTFPVRLMLDLLLGSMLMTERDELARQAARFC